MEATENVSGAVPVAGTRRRLRRSASVAGLLLRRNPLGALGLAIVVGVVVLAAGASVIAPYGPNNAAFDALASPSASHWFGTDLLGRDIFSRVVYGARVALIVGFGSVVFGLIVGTVGGLVSGYVGGWVDSVLQRITDVLMAFPLIILAIFIAAAWGQGVWKGVFILGIAVAPAVTRIVRGSALSEKERDYVLSARAIGTPQWRIVFRHILPNVAAPIIVLGTVLLSITVLAEASLSFLGVGVPPTTASWGGDLSGNARTYFQIAPWMAIFPGLALTITVLGLNFLGDALRDVLDPRLQKEMLRKNV